MAFREALHGEEPDSGVGEELLIVGGHEASIPRRLTLVREAHTESRFKMSASPEAIQHWTDTACGLCGQGEPLPFAYKVIVDGRPWFTDGHIMFRGAWPGLHGTAAGEPKMAPLLSKLDASAPPPCTGESDGVRVTLSTGTPVSAEWWPELTAGRELVPHHAGGLEPVVFRDAAGAIAAVLMPLKPDDGSPTDTQ